MGLDAEPPALGTLLCLLVSVTTLPAEIWAPYLLLQYFHAPPNKGISVLFLLLTPLFDGVGLGFPFVTLPRADTAPLVPELLVYVFGISVGNAPLRGHYNPIIKITKSFIANMSKVRNGPERTRGAKSPHSQAYRGKVIVIGGVLDTFG